MSIEQEIKETDNWFKGEDKQFIFTVYQSDDVTLQDLSGWTLQWDLRQVPESSVSILSKTPAIDADPATGICTVTIAAADTVSLAPGTYFHTLWRINSGSRSVLSHGNALLQQPDPIV